MKQYIKPTIEDYDMAPVSILEGSVTVKTKVGISDFFTDHKDWASETNPETNQQERKYTFWE